MQAIECAKAIQQPINKLGSAFMMDGATFARASEVGAEPGLGFYVIGRFGTLGNVHPDVIAASAVFFSPAAVAEYWTAAVAKSDPFAAAALFMDCAQNWGRANLASADGLARFNELGTRVVDHASPNAAALFAGLRALPRTADDAGLAIQLSFALRELRMARHVIAVLAERVTPLEVILNGGGGEGNAQMFGWAPPFPDVSASVQRRQAAEDRTNELHADDLSVLSAEERAEFAASAANLVGALG